MKKLTRVLQLISLTLCLLAPSWAAPSNIHGKVVVHKVSAGEDLASIALKYSLAVDHLAFANGLPIASLDLVPGSELIIPTMRILPSDPPANGIVVNLPERILYLFKNGAFVKHYPVSIGDESFEKGRFQTPTGSFHIIEKIANPTWFPPAWNKDQKPVPPGPNNPLGERWIGLSLPRVGIHGTADPLNVGNSVTHGCMRTHNETLKELFNQVSVGMPIRIEYETARIGKDQAGNLYVCTFPDVYKKSDSFARIQNLIRSSKATPRRSNFNDILKLNLGMPIRLAGQGSLYDEWVGSKSDSGRVK